MKAFSLAVAAATTLAASVASAQVPQTNGDAGTAAPASPSSQASSQTPVQVPVQVPGATEPLPPLPQVAPSAVTPVAPSAGASASVTNEAQLGGRGESCRARSDCKTGLACFENVCSLASDRRTCVDDSECGDLACAHGLCSAHPHATESSKGERKTTFDLDEMISSRTAISSYYYGYPTYSGYGNYTTPARTEATETTASSIIGFRHRTGSLEIDGSLPFALRGVSGGSLSGAFGNITIGAYFAHETESIRLRVGGGIALPTAGTSSDSRDTEQAAAYARGMDRIWLWTPNSVTLTPSVLIGARSDAVFQHATELVLAPLVPTGSANDTATVVVQVSEDLGAHVGLFRGGARAEIVTTTQSSSIAQISILPYLGVDGPGGFADIGLLINLNEPAGFSFDETKYWGLRLRGGIRF